jgi:CO/xanthine dehydrogenase Mo-binding subunit
MATVNAARNLKTLLQQGAALLQGVAVGEADLSAVDLATVCARLAPGGRPLRAEGYFILPQAAGKLEGVVGAPHHVSGYCAQAVWVEVDSLTGETRVDRVVSAIDCGKVINPVGLEGQSEGGVVMGLGMALCEDTVMEGGLHRTRNFTTYILPTTCETPLIETIAVESTEETGPFGAKGIGEVVMIPVVAAVPKGNVSKSDGLPCRRDPLYVV